VSEAPSVEKGRQDVVVAVAGSGTAPVLFMQGLASARPATLLSP
jgi:N-acetylmuramic acid 6-phosphate (MurNAc-6-P) etherase